MVAPLPVAPEDVASAASVRITAPFLRFRINRVSLLLPAIDCRQQCSVHMTLHATRAVFSEFFEMRIRIQAVKWPFEHLGFRRGAKCCMGAPRGNNSSFAPLGTKDASRC